MSTLSDDLERLAGTTPAGPPPGDLWQRGRRRVRRRRGLALAAGAAAVAVVAGVTAGPTLTRTDAPPAAGLQERHLPRHLWAPDPDAKGTDELGPLGPVAVLGTAWRSGTPRHADPGDTPDDGTYRALFGISAVDGTTRWIDLPKPVDRSTCNVSPTGDLVACEEVNAPTDTEPSRASAFLVLDTTTGRTRSAAFPTRMDYESTEEPAVQFTRDGRYVTAFLARPGQDRPQLWGLDVTGPNDSADFAAIPLTGSDERTPVLGDSPSGILWTTRDEVSESVLASTMAYPLPTGLSRVSVSPDRTRAVALRRDPRTSELQLVTTANPFERDDSWVVAYQGRGLGRPLGWLDGDRVAILRPRGDKPWAVLDLRDDSLRQLPLERHELPGASYAIDQYPYVSISYAVGLLQNPTVAGERPPVVLSAATWRKVGIGGLGVVLLGGWLVWRRVRRA